MSNNVVRLYNDQYKLRWIGKDFTIFMFHIVSGKARMMATFDIDDPRPFDCYEYDNDR